MGNILCGCVLKVLLFGRSNRVFGMAEAAGGSRFDLHKNQTVAVTADEINFAAPRAEIAVNYFVPFTPQKFFCPSFAAAADDPCQEFHFFITETAA